MLPQREGRAEKRRWMLWSHGRYHRADMDALVTRTLSSRGHGCSGHTCVIIVRTGMLLSHGRSPRADMDALVTRTSSSCGRGCYAIRCRKNRVFCISCARMLRKCNARALLCAFARSEARKCRQYRCFRHPKATKYQAPQGAHGCCYYYYYYYYYYYDDDDHYYCSGVHLMSPMTFVLLDMASWDQAYTVMAWDWAAPRTVARAELRPVQVWAFSSICRLAREHKLPKTMAALASKPKWRPHRLANV